MEFQASARKWRPDTFADVVAQGHVGTTLRNAIQKERIGHSYIFSGPRGVGKTTAARIFAKALNCLNPVDGDPCNSCDNCNDIRNSRFIDLFEIDGASNNGVDNVRDIRDALRYPPQKGTYKTYIIDEVHMLSIGAFNALLKTLEEPPEYAVFIFATTEIHKVPATILSRCQRFDFRRITTSEIMERLRFITGQEGIQADEESLLVIARKADGALRDALSILDQVVAFFGKELTGSELSRVLNVLEQDLYFRLTDTIIQHDVKSALLFLDEIIGKGYDLPDFLGGLAEHLRNLLVVVTTGESTLLDISEGYKEKYLQSASNFHYLDLLRYLNMVAEAETQVKLAVNPRLRVELLLAKLCTMDQTVTIQEVLKQLKKVEQELAKALSNRQSEPAVAYTAKPHAMPIPDLPVNLPSPVKPPVPVQEVVYPVAKPDSGTQKGKPPAFPQLRTQKPVTGTTTSGTPVRQETKPASVPFSKIQEDWPYLISKIRDDQKVSLAGVLEHADLISLEGSNLVLKVYRIFDKQQIERQAFDISEQFNRLFGFHISPVVQLDETGQAPFMKDDPAVVFEELKKTNPLFKKIVDKFNAEPI